MKKSRLLGAVCACVLSFVTTSSCAALIDNGGGLIYDTVLDITWAQPDNFLKNWNDATPWAAGLTLGGVSGWRLPYMSVAAGADPFTGSPVDCRPKDNEEACRDNELGYMFYQNLSGTFGSSILTSGDPDLALFLFPTDQSWSYWSGTRFPFSGAWNLNFGTGDTLFDDVFSHVSYSWAVHAGDVSPIPIPSAVWLFGSGLLGLIGIAIRK